MGGRVALRLVLWLACSKQLSQSAGASTSCLDESGQRLAPGLLGSPTHEVACRGQVRERAASPPIAEEEDEDAEQAASGGESSSSGASAPRRPARRDAPSKRLRCQAGPLLLFVHELDGRLWESD